MYRGSAHDVLKFLDKTIQGSICEKINSKKPDIGSTLRLSFPTQYLSQVMESEFWPEGVIVNKFFMRRRLINPPIPTSPSRIMKKSIAVDL